MEQWPYDSSKYGKYSEHVYGNGNRRRRLYSHRERSTDGKCEPDREPKPVGPKRMLWQPCNAERERLGR